MTPHQSRQHERHTLAPRVKRGRAATRDFHAAGIPAGAVTMAGLKNAICALMTPAERREFAAMWRRLADTFGDDDGART